MNNSLNWFNSIYSDGSKWFVSNPLPHKGDKITIALQVSQNAPLSCVFLRTKPNGVEQLVKMQQVSCRNGLCRYEAEVQVWEDELHYQFYLTTCDCIYYYSQAGVTTYIQDESRDFRILTDYQQPEWVKNAVFYQIFPT